jgi:glycine/D-amino acid oxidase-like deaminating enzyme
MRGARVIVVGAGIVGAACARAVARDHFAVVLVDGGIIGGGATAAGMGHVVVMDDSDAQFALCHYSQQLWDELAPALPANCEFDRCGTLWVAEDEQELALARGKETYYQALGVAAEVLDGARLAAAEPNLRPGLAGGLRVPGDSVVYPPCVARWLVEDAQKRGAEVRLGVPVAGLREQVVTLADGARLEADAVVNAAGMAAGRLTPGLPIRAKKGQLVITDRYPGFVHHQTLELGYLRSAHGTESASVAFNVQPRRTGQMLIGSSRQYDDESRPVDPTMLQRMLQRALAFMPALARLSAIRAWTGVRAATPDSLPLVGPHPGFAGLVLAAGHEGLGITTSLGTAELVSAHLGGRSFPIPPGPYLPARFVEGGRGGHGEPEH